MAGAICSCGFGEVYFALEGEKNLCTICGGEVRGAQDQLFEPSTPATEPEPGTRVLVVDDQPYFRLVIRDILEKKGYQVLEAADGVEGVRSVADGLRAGPTHLSERVGLAILDLNMPGLLDGFQTLGVLKAMDDHLPVLILTASPPTAELLKKLGQLKAKKYLNKSSKNLEELLLRNLEGA